jgi:hypothetical protein
MLKRITFEMLTGMHVGLPVKLTVLLSDFNNILNCP